ncbi:MAG: PDZ domain-containing protein [Caldilinea sp. CFX5]|nr:PDZ domain-containing protein [Caldilinea sp. CFX5]
MSQATITLTRTINAPVEQLYRAFTNAQALREWFCDIATAQPRVGGAFYVAWNNGDALLGKYTAVEPNKKVGLYLRAMDDTDRSTLTITFDVQGDATTLTLVDTSDGAQWLQIKDEVEQGWRDALEVLQTGLETGVDLREARRPMLGIALTGAQPGDIGVRLGGVIAGMDAQRAGLQKDDQVLSIGGKATPDWSALTAALGAHRAGDVVAVTYERAGQQQQSQITLSPRPMPPTPTTAAEMADQLRQSYAAIRDEMTALLQDVTEQQATQPPAAGEWSVKAALAHLLLSERTIQCRVGWLLGDLESGPDNWDGSLPAQITAVLTAYPTLAALTQAFQASLTETTALLAALPPTFVAQKRSFNRIAHEMTTWSDHIHDHLAQIKGALQTS